MFVLEIKNAVSKGHYLLTSFNRNVLVSMYLYIPYLMYIQYLMSYASAPSICRLRVGQFILHEHTNIASENNRSAASLVKRLHDILSSAQSMFILFVKLRNDSYLYRKQV